MTEEEMNQLRMITPVNDVVNIQHLNNKEPRTLLFGYDTDRTTIHVYICPISNEIRTITYGSYTHNMPRFRIIHSNEDYVPTKRIYPHKSDFEFCKLLAERATPMAFANYEDSEDEQFYGKTI